MPSRRKIIHQEGAAREGIPLDHVWASLEAAGPSGKTWHVSWNDGQSTPNYSFCKSYAFCRRQDYSTRRYSKVMPHLSWACPPTTSQCRCAAIKTFEVLTHPGKVTMLALCALSVREFFLMKRFGFQRQKKVLVTICCILQ